MEKDKCGQSFIVTQCVWVIHTARNNYWKFIAVALIGRERASCSVIILHIRNVRIGQWSSNLITFGSVNDVWNREDTIDWRTLRSWKNAQNWLQDRLLKMFQSLQNVMPWEKKANCFFSSSHKPIVFHRQINYTIADSCYVELDCFVFVRMIIKTISHFNHSITKTRWMRMVYNFTNIINLEIDINA